LTPLPCCGIEGAGFKGAGHSVGDFVNKRHFTIDWAYCDPAGIVFNGRFFEFFDTSSWHLFEAALGVKPHKMSETFEILGVPLVDARAKFMVPAKFGDVVEMHSYIGEFRRSSFEVCHQIFVDGQLAVDGSETRVWAALDPATGQLKTKPIPAEVMAKFKTP
jgi:4-hydroxybenzoyl-CoA thioesterase